MWSYIFKDLVSVTRFSLHTDSICTQSQRRSRERMKTELGLSPGHLYQLLCLLIWWRAVRGKSHLPGVRKENVIGIAGNSGREGLAQETKAWVLGFGRESQY